MHLRQHQMQHFAMDILSQRYYIYRLNSIKITEFEQFNDAHFANFFVCNKTMRVLNVQILKAY